jgi:selenocysteine-specific elongation factor
MGISKGEIVARLHDLVALDEVVTYAHAGREYFAHIESWIQLLEGIRVAMTGFHTANPLRSGAGRNELRPLVVGRPSVDFYETGIDHLVREGELKVVDALLCLRDYRIQLSADQDGMRNDILSVLKQGGTTPTDLKGLPEVLKQDEKRVQNVVVAMHAMGEVIRLDDGVLLLPDVMANIESQVVGYFQTHDQIDVATFRDLVGTTRKYAVPMLNYLDTKGVTMRQGDIRVLMR